MTHEEAARLLALIALGDNRQVTAELAAYWHGLLPDIRYDDAVQAVAIHRRESAEWLQPAHIIRLVRTARALRIDAANLVHEPVATDSIEQDRQRQAALVRAAGDGQLGPRRLELVAPTGPIALPELVTAKAAASRAARRPLQIPCPYCHAPAGNACRIGKRTRPGFMHPARREACGAETTNGAAT